MRALAPIYRQRELCWAVKMLLTWECFIRVYVSIRVAMVGAGKKLQLGEYDLCSSLDNFVKEFEREIAGIVSNGCHYIVP